MKLSRDRKKRVWGSIKQEECKPAALATLTTARSSTSTAADTGTDNPTIKQEATREDKSLLKQHAESAEKDYYYRCDKCAMRMADLATVLKHRETIHGIKNIGTRKIKYMDEEPDIHNPNFYCKSCESRYKDARLYRQHLRSAHYMVLKRIPNWKTPHNSILPDPNDPSLYCRACDHTYASKTSYKTHCRYTHGMKHGKYSNQNPTSNSTTDSYCQVCDRRLSSMYSYRQHLLAVHKEDSRPPQQKRNDMLPNVNDPKFYCRSCEKKMASRSSFRQHLMLVHSIFQAAPRKKSRLNPDVNNPNNYCRAWRIR
ncbi:hypothetical protein MBANPS3_004520 [Mucor bainieri]